MRRKALILVAAALALLITVAPVGAITFGQPDGNRHPYVGALIAEWRTPGVKEEFCSGTLIAPTVFLTASHCTAGLQARGIQDHDVWVSFDTDIGDPVRPSTTLIRGTMHTHPEFGFSGPGGFSDPHDIAVIVLDQDASTVYPGIQPAALPAAGLLDQMALHNGLRDQEFTAVGYGDQRTVKTGGPHGIFFTGVRFYATQGFLSLTMSWITLSENISTGSGGTCFGDSGGPHFLDDSNLIVAITITGDAQCRATDKDYRVDTPAARAFLAEFVTLP